VWAFATAGVAAPGLLCAIAAVVVQRRLLGQFKPQEIANTVWAFATAGVAAPELFRAIAAEIARRRLLGEFNAQDFSNTVWAFATAGVAAPGLFRDFASEISQRQLDQFKPQNISNIVWAFATAGVAAPGLFRDVASEIARRQLGQFNTQVIANTVWAFATAGVAAPAVFKALFTAAFALPAERFTTKDLVQLWQAVLFVRHEAPDASIPVPDAALEARLRSAMADSDERPSNQQRAVSAALRRIGWAHEFEHRTAEGLSLDMAQPGNKVCVEFDGPSHFLTTAQSPQQSLVPDGSTQFSTRLLRALGWTVVRVPYWEWNPLHRDEPAQDAYLRRKLHPVIPN